MFYDKNDLELVILEIVSHIMCCMSVVLCIYIYLVLT